LLTLVGDTLFFYAYEDTTGYELWRTDGTEAGTMLVADIFPGPGNSFVYEKCVAAAGGKLFLAAAHPTFGVELWVAFADTDGDGTPDGEDTCPSSDLRPTVVLAGCDSGVANRVLGNGCTLGDRVASLVAESASEARNHGQFVSCVAHSLNELKKAGLITGQEKGALQRCAARANPVRLTPLGRNKAGGFRLSIGGLPGTTVQLQRSANLRDWSDWGRHFTLGATPTERTDGDANSAGQFFYRAVRR
jgi:ELWxxDGT repeat protein